MQGSLLDDRGVVEVGGPEAGDLLQRLVTNDVLGLAPGDARYAALLTPQGKILVDFLVVMGIEDEAAVFRLDCPLALAADLARRLTLYRLRAKVTVLDRSRDLGVAALWPGPVASPGGYRDPRSDSIGFRIMAPRADLEARLPAFGMADYAAHRILAGVPEGGVDFAYGETFPHDANLDRLHGLDFSKGCYVGQEVVSRVQHRGTARKRIAAVSFEGPQPPVGGEVRVGEIPIGSMGSSVPGHGLAMVRIDRALEAASLGAAITCAGTHLMVATQEPM